MVQPIQYTVKAPSAFESLVSGLRLGTSLQQIQLQREQQMAAMQQAQQQAEAERQRQMSLQEFYRKARNNEPLTTTDWLQYGETSGTKEYRELASRQIQNMSEAEQSARAGTMGQMISAFWTNPDIGLQIARDYKAANQNDQGFDPILKMAETRPKEAAIALYGMMSGLGGKFGDVSKNLADTLGMKAEKPEATPEILRAIDALGLPRNLDSIRRYSEATQRPETMPALQKAQAYRQTLQQRGMQNTSEYAENEQYIRNLLVDPTAQTQAQIEANRIAQARLDQSERLNDPLYVENLAAARARGTATGEAAAAKEAQRSAAVTTLASIGYNPETGEDDISRLIARSTSGGLQAGAAGIARFLGGTTEGMAAINELQAAANSITTDILGGRLGAGISNTDREFILAALGDVGNEQKTAGERYAGWTRAKNRMVQVGMLPKPRPRGAAQQQTQTPRPAPAGGAPQQPTVSNW
jgi:hypothetical protein